VLEEPLVDPNREGASRRLGTGGPRYLDEDPLAFFAEFVVQELSGSDCPRLAEPKGARQGRNATKPRAQRPRAGFDPAAAIEFIKAPQQLSQEIKSATSRLSPRVWPESDVLEAILSE
jgi:hypothetical protein